MVLCGTEHSVVSFTGVSDQSLSTFCVCDRHSQAGNIGIAEITHVINRREEEGMSTVWCKAVGQPNPRKPLLLHSNILNAKWITEASTSKYPNHKTQTAAQPSSAPVATDRSARKSESAKSVGNLMTTL